ncbi:MAG: arginine--tRNA ligase [Bacilli bacterium]|nr:arginine--tRNA ligase [Bacilli bacterium]
MNIVEVIKFDVFKALSSINIEVSLADIVIEKSKDPVHGDYASNVALKFARLAHKAPRDFATDLVKVMNFSYVDHLEIAGPGFINFFLKNDSLQSIVKKVLTEGDNYGRNKEHKQKVNVEFVSANPTGDLHVGTARGAAIGDSLARILEFDGNEVTREYYINDAGNQIYNLALSIQARYQELQGLDFTLPEDGYHGEDVRKIAHIIYDEIGEEALHMEDPVSYFKERGIELELKKIREVLEDFDVKFDVFSSEREIRKDNAVEKEIKALGDNCYEEEGAIKLATSRYLDDKDRVIVKSNGDYTYFLPDICYHLNKLSRGFDRLIDVLGADHHGYINRMKSALMMHGYKPDVLDITLIQMVRFIKDGVEKKASKRSGDAYTLKELIEDVGKDAARYFFAMRAASGHLDFDLGLAVEQSSNNPVYYAQYAHARMCSVLEQGKDLGIDESAANLVSDKEKAILKHLESFPEVISGAAKELAPHLITNYVHNLAELIHAWYNDSKIIDRDNIEVSKSRLALCKASKQVIKNALWLVGVSAPTHM